MCQVQIVSADGSMMKARSLLNSASSISFITESLGQRLHLRHLRHSMKRRWDRWFCNPTFLTWNGGSQHSKSLWRLWQWRWQCWPKSPPICCPVQSHSTADGAFVKYPLGWPQLWHPRKCWSTPRSRYLQPYNVSHLAISSFGITNCFQNMF